MFLQLKYAIAHVVVRKYDVRVSCSFSDNKVVCVVNCCNCFLLMSMSEMQIVIYVESCGMSSILNLYCNVCIGVHEG